MGLAQCRYYAHGSLTMQPQAELLVRTTCHWNEHSLS